MSESNLVFFNGINATRGGYDLPPMSAEELAKMIAGTTPPENLNELRFRSRMGRDAYFGVTEGIDPTNLAEAGWGIVFPARGNPAVREALGELIELRRSQTGPNFRLYAEADGYQPGESKNQWLARHGAGPGPADPANVPYYLLLVGDPETIPYRFQSQLDVQYAVGRIHFDDLDAYAAYARSVVLAESGAVSLPRRMTFFGVANPDDPATQRSTDELVMPLLSNLGKIAREERSGWQIDGVLREEATRSRLERLLGGPETPALLFTTGHGMIFDPGDARQRPQQGALLCQDWPGPGAWRDRPIPEEHYFAGDHVADDANLLGLISFFFACYGGGTPQHDQFARGAFQNRKEVAPEPFLAGLPRRMLGHPGGGALAVIGHVERAWGYSFFWPQTGQQTEVFEATLRRLMNGHPVGSAVEYFNERYAELSAMLADELEEIEFGKSADPYYLTGLWTANNDARAYTIIGDPAVRLPVAPPGETGQARPVVTLQNTDAPEPKPEPEPAPADEATPGPPETLDDLLTLLDLGPEYGAALRAYGIGTISRLGGMSVDGLLPILSERNLPASPADVAAWLERARTVAQLEPERSLLIPDEDLEPKLYVSLTSRPWHLPVDGLVLPADGEGNPGDGLAGLLEPLDDAAREELTARIAQSLEPDFGLAHPAVVPLDEAVAARLLPNRPGETGRQCFLIVATAAGAADVTDLRLATRSIVLKAAAAGVTRLGVLTPGLPAEHFQGRAPAVAGQIVHGMWAARFDPAAAALAEITYVPRESDALQAAREKALSLTRNRPQEVWGDQPAALDLLGIKDEAEALAETLLLRQVRPPISVAVLGGWGSGKSTVMRLMMKRMTQARIAAIRRGWPEPGGSPEEEDPALSTRVGHIYQMRFNAWTYAKSNLWASLMQTIFWELNRQLSAEKALSEYQKSRGTAGRSPLEGGEAFQFLYDEYGWVEPRAWNRLTLEERAALQPNSTRNILWQQLRAQQQLVLKKLQEREAAIARLKAQKERAEAQRRKEIIRQLNQESRSAAYQFLLRRSRVALGDLSGRVEAEVARKSKLALGQQLRETVLDLAARAKTILHSFSQDTLAPIRDLLQELSELDREAPAVAPETSAADLDEVIGALRDTLARAEERADGAARLAWSEAAAPPDPLVTALNGMKQQAQAALHSTGTLESAEALFVEIDTLSTTLKQIWQAAMRQKTLTVVLVVVAALLLAIPVLIFTQPTEFTDGLVARAAGIISAILAFATLLGPPIRVASRWSRQAAQLMAEYQEAAAAERKRYETLVEANLAAARAADEQALQEQLKDEGGDGQSAAGRPLEELTTHDNLAALDYRISQLQLEAEELRRQAGPPGEYASLLDFVQARQDEQFYEKRLGLMHQVKRDIDVLTSGLVIQPQDEPEVRQAKRELFPRGPARVVLYIDDLDRCPPGRVVEVLEAVQLLLNTELFVIVLGLDTRYITRALEKEYKEILQPDGDPSGLDYIEKILQLPYRVRPIGRQGIARFLEAQMDVVPEGESTETGPAAGVVPAPAAAGAPTAGVPVTAPDGGAGGDAEPAAGAPAEAKPGEADAQPGAAGGPAGDGVTPAPSAAEPAENALEEVPPEIIRFRPADLEDLTACCQLLHLTPRNVKRMVNVLKLIHVFWFRTGGDLRPRRVKSTVMGLLALSAAYPEIMREIFDRIDIGYRNAGETGARQVGDYLQVDDLAKNNRWWDGYQGLVARFRADVQRLYDPDDLEHSLIGVTLADLEEETFQLVRSFSFVGDPVYLNHQDGKVAVRRTRPPGAEPPVPAPDQSN